MKAPRAPSGLKAPGKRFWKKAHAERVHDEVQDTTRLELACRCLDEIDELQKVVEKEGRIIQDRFFQSKEHPAAKAIRDNKILFCRIVRELGLDLPVPESRPPMRY